ncbi:MAG: divergent polysaccharide deacetylase family protein [Caulobacteraceae bacterium]
MAQRPLVMGLFGALAFSGAAAGLLLAANPRAGTPEVRLSLARIDPLAATATLAPATSPPSASADGTGATTVELTSAPDSSLTADSSVPIGGAVITLPDQAPMMVGVGATLAQAPLTGFSEPSPGGPLPVIAPDGVTPAQAYARPFTSDGKPEIALIVGGLGLNAQATREAINDLPPQITLSFVPYADGLQGWIDLARSAGHEVLLEAPMEPADYPSDDPGPYTLMVGDTAAQIARKLDWLMSRASGYFGFTNYLGGKFLASPSSMAGFDAILKRRGLAFIDDGLAARNGGDIPRATASRIIDASLAPAAIEQQLAELETDASHNGSALGSGFAYPVTLKEASTWAKSLGEKGYQLVPASALAKVR